MSVKIPKLKYQHKPIKLPRNYVQIGMQYPMARQVKDNENWNVFRILSLINGERSVEEIVSVATSMAPGIPEEEVKMVIKVLFSEGMLEDVSVPPPMELTEKDLERYDRSFQYFSLVDLRPDISRYYDQLKLKQSRVTIAGLGGVGLAIATSLTASGVGSLKLVDYDVVEISNLTRQFLYEESDVGKSKVKVAVERLKKRNSDIDLKGIEMEIRSVEDFLELMTDTDLFILASDTPHEIVDWCNLAALYKHIPWFHAGYLGPRVAVTGYVPYQTGCVQCKRTHGDQLNPYVKYSLPETPLNAIIGPVSALSAHFCALEAIRFLTGMPCFTVGKEFLLNAVAYEEVEVHDIPKDKSCAVCGNEQ